MNLNKFQRDVVEHRSGCAAVFAGAGSGKTTCMVQRAARLVDNGADPATIQIVVYNRSAAEVASQRLSELGHYYGYVKVNTFHSLASQLCREFVPELIGSKKILDTDGAPKQIGLVFEAMRDANIREGDWKEWMLRADLARELLIPFDEIADNAARLKVPGSYGLDLQRFCTAYARIKEQRNVIDFNDLPWMLACTPAALERIYGRCAHLMIDEAQDATPLRWLIADSIAYSEAMGLVESYVAVGDPCQSIYSYQGADPELFMERASAWETFVLPTNFRSGKAIIDLGNQVVEGRLWKIGDAIPRDNAGSGSINHLASVDDVVKHLRTSIDAGWSFEGGPEGSTVILCRTNADVAAYEISLIVNGIPCRTRNSTGSVWESQYGTLFLSYLQFCSGLAHGFDNHDDAWQLLESIYSRPNRFIRKDTLRSAFCGGFECLLSHKMRNIQELAQALSVIAQNFRRDKFGLAVDRIASLLSQDVKKRAGNVLGQADEDKIGLINVLASAATQAGGINGIIDQVDAVASAADEPHVLLSTIHRAKGGEWKRVYADIGWVKAAIERRQQASKSPFGPTSAGLLEAVSENDPAENLSAMAVLLDDNDARLAYVMTTRAIDELYLIGGI